MEKLETMLTQYFKYLESKGRTFNALVGIILSATVGVIDYLAPETYAFGFLYVLTIAFTAWFSSKYAGLIVAVGCTLLWSVDRFKLDIIYASVWNSLSALGIFCFVSYLLTKMHMMWEIECSFSNKDPLTGVLNRRAFSTLAEYEVLISQRECKPLSMAYLDIDDFKKVNDHYGHEKGDELLVAVVACIAQHIRKTDIVARMGGDEFTILLPATDQAAVKVVMEKVVEELNQLSTNSDWPTTFSVGVVTYKYGAAGFSEIVATADKLMYRVKKSGKNSILFDTYPIT